MPSKKDPNHFIAMWDHLGLECIFDAKAAFHELENWEKLKVISILKEERQPIKPQGIPLQMMILRARMNSQRNYEIYEFITGMEMDEVKQLFKTSPQIIVDSIRNVGHCIYSDRETTKKVIS